MELQAVLKRIVLRHPLRRGAAAVSDDPLAHVADYFRVPVEQIVARPAAKFVFDRNAELPIRLQRREPAVMYFLGDWWKREQAVHKDIDRYQIYNVLQEAYDHVRLQHPDAPPLLADCTSGQAMLQTYETLGSLHYSQPGTCFVKANSKACMILDAAVHAQRLVGSVLKVTRRSRPEVCPPRMVSTGSTMVTIPIAASDRYRILKEEHSIQADCDLPEAVKPWVMENWDIGVGIPKGLGVVKRAVEIDRSLLGQANVIFFEPVDMCHNRGRVWDRLRDIDSESCEGTKLVASLAFSRRGPRFYILMPKAMDEMELPSEWRYGLVPGDEEVKFSFPMHRERAAPVPYARPVLPRSAWFKLFFRAVLGRNVHGPTYYPRPILERPLKERGKLRKAARAFGVEATQIVLRPPAKILFDGPNEIPVRFQPQLAPAPAFYLDWWSDRVVQKDLHRYNIYRVMQDIYEHVKVRMPGQTPERFLECRTGTAMLETFKMLGSLGHYELGTCFGKSKSGDAFVIVDEAVDRKKVIDETLEVMKHKAVSRKRPLRRTFSTMITVPRAVFEAKQPGILQEESLSGLLQTSGVKVAVEIDMRVVGVGNIIFFAPLEVADNADAVWKLVQGMDKEVLGCSLKDLRLVDVDPTQHEESSIQACLPRVYTLLPDFMLEEEKHLWNFVPFEWAAFVSFSVRDVLCNIALISTSSRNLKNELTFRVQNGGNQRI